MAKDRVSNIVMENAKIIFPNFSGAKRQFNDEGKRNFNLIIEDLALAEQLVKDGWNIKFPKPPEDPDMDPLPPMLKVNVSYKVKAPNVFVVSNKKTRLDEDTIGLLDSMNFENIDLVINPSFYDFNGKQGISAYLSSMYVTPLKDEFADKYIDIPDAMEFDEEPF